MPWLSHDFSCINPLTLLSVLRIRHCVLFITDRTLLSQILMFSQALLAFKYFIRINVRQDVVEWWRRWRCTPTTWTSLKLKRVTFIKILRFYIKSSYSWFFVPQLSGTSRPVVINIIPQNIFFFKTCTIIIQWECLDNLLLKLNGFILRFIVYAISEACSTYRETFSRHGLKESK